MKIILKPIGDLRDYFGREPLEIELPENATAKDLLTVIGEGWSTKLPAYLWDAQKCKFRGAVYLVVDKKVIQHLSTPLHDGIEVVLLKALSGG
jgi:hypothetical protein